MPELLQRSIGLQQGIASPQKVLTSVVGSNANFTDLVSPVSSYTYSTELDGVFGWVNLDSALNETYWEATSYTYTQTRPYARLLPNDTYDPFVRNGASTLARTTYFPDGPLGTVEKNFGGEIVNGTGATTLETSRYGTVSSTMPAFVKPGKHTTLQFGSGAGSNYGYNYVSNGNVAYKDETADGVTRRQWFAYGAGGGGFLTATVDPAGATTSYVRDSMGRATKVTHPDGSMDDYTYDPAPGRKHLVTQWKQTIYLPEGGTQIRFTDYQYNADGRMTLKTYPTDANGLRATESWVYTYTSGGYTSNMAILTSHTYPDGTSETFSYDVVGTGALLSSTDRFGTQYTYDYQRNQVVSPVYNHSFLASQCLTETRWDGSTPSDSLRVIYELGNRNVWREQPGGALWKVVVHFEGGRVMEDYSLATGFGATPLLAYHAYETDFFGRVTAQWDSRNRMTTRQFESATNGGGCSCNSGNNPTQITDPMGRVTKFNYDGFWRRTRTAVAAGSVEELRYDVEYDLRGNVIKEYASYAPSLPLMNRITAATHEYDVRGRRTATTDILGRRTVYSYDGAGNLKKTTRPDGSYTTNTYDGRDRLISSTNSHSEMINGVSTWVHDTTNYVYDVAGRLTQATSPGGRVVAHQYNTNGTLWTTTEGVGTASAATTTYSYDVFGRVQSVQAPDGKTTSYTYAANDQVGTVTDAGSRVTTYYRDEFGRVYQTNHPDGTITYRAYATDGYGDLLSETDANGAVTAYEYYPDGTLWKLIDPRGQIRQWTYNLRGQLQQKIWPDSTTDSYSYRSADGLLAAHTTPSGSVETYGYNTLLQVTSRIWTNTTQPTPSVTYEYETAVGSLKRLLAVKSENGSSLVSRVSFTYDGLSRKKSETQEIPGASSTATVNYGYDSDGNLAKLTYPDGNVVDYTYTARNQLWQVQNGGPPVATYAYDLAGRLTNLDRENGVNTVLTHGTAAGELTAVDHAKGASYVDGVLYALNANNGRREGITRSGGWNDAYSYDAAGQVTSASYAANTTGMGSEGFAYDAAGNRTSSVKNGTNVTEYAPNSLDQYSAIGGVSQAHDANGNLTTFVPPVSGVLPITMKWDGENRLTEITKTGHKVTNVYDALHRRILKKIHDDDTAVIAKTIAFVYDGWNVIQETEYAGSTTTVVSQKRYTWGADVSGSLQGAGGVGGLLMAEETVISGTTQTTPIPHYYQYDGNGNVIAITDATGTTEGRYRYTAFGGAANTVTNTTFAATQPYRFSTKYLDKEVETAEGTYFYGFRHYVPVIGRWPSRDPIGERGGRNLYGMVGNDALGRVDVLGLCEGPEITAYDLKFYDGHGKEAGIGSFSSIMGKHFKDKLEKGDYSKSLKDVVGDVNKWYSALYEVLKGSLGGLYSAELEVSYRCCVCGELGAEQSFKIPVFDNSADAGIANPALSEKHSTFNLRSKEGWKQLLETLTDAIEGAPEAVQEKCNEGASASEP